ncbi:MAG TPA: sugar phosphate isomerase/epimerase [Candidatus Acidoferrum sp.]|nr:sugar phosphate isomerase/epimerase [Candidatus Acidoferrum sp.]
MKFGICNEIFQDWKLEDAMTFAKKAGYDGIEVAPFTLAKYVTEIPADERARIRETAARIGIEISGIHWVLVQAEGMYLNHIDEEVRRRTANYFVELVNFCADLGGRIIVVGSPKQRNVMDGITPEQAWTWATETFRAAVKRAEDRGVTICFEPLAPSETNFINTAADGILFARQFNSRAMKIILDVKAMCSEAKEIPQIIRESRGEFAYFHANDKNLKGPGFGEVDFVPIAAALREVNYDGYVSVEVFKFEEGAEVIATKSIEYLKRVFGR